MARLPRPARARAGGRPHAGPRFCQPRVGRPAGRGGGRRRGAPPAARPHGALSTCAWMRLDAMRCNANRIFETWWAPPARVMMRPRAAARRGPPGVPTSRSQRAAPRALLATQDTRRPPSGSAARRDSRRGGEAATRTRGATGDFRSGRAGMRIESIATFMRMCWVPAAPLARARACRRRAARAATQTCRHPSLPIINGARPGRARPPTRPDLNTRGGRRGNRRARRRLRNSCRLGRRARAARAADGDAIAMLPCAPLPP